MTNAIPTRADLEQSKRDMDDISTFNHSGDSNFVDNQGQRKLTLQGLIEAALAATGYVTVGTFATGCTVTAYNQVVSDGVSLWRWGGTLPKTVAAGSSPSPSAANAWSTVSDSGFKESLAQPTSSDTIAGFIAKQLRLINGIKNLITVEGVTMHVNGYYANSSYGGGEFYYSSTTTKDKHNGGTIIAPEALAAWDGAESSLSTLLNWSGTGNGCFIRKTDNAEIDLSWYGSTLTNFYPISLTKAQTSSNASTSIKGFFDNATATGDLYIGNAFLGSNVDIAGTINLNGYKFTVEVIGKKVNIGKLTNTQDSVNSFILKDSYNCKVVIMEIDGSNYPVKLFSNKGSGCFNNEISVYRTRAYGTAGDTEVSCWLITVDGGGFCNENHIRAGFMTGQRGIYFKKGTGQTAKFDGNKIIAPMFELIDYRGIEFNFGSFNHMFDARYEASHTPSDVWIHEAADSYNLKITGAQPVYSNKIRLLGDKTQYMAPLFSAEGDNSVGFRFCSVAYWRGNDENEGIGLAPIMGNSSPKGTIALRKNLATDPLVQFAFYVKKYNGDVVAAGEIEPYGYHETGESNFGDIILANNISWIMCRPPTTTTDVVSLIMPTSRQIEGREVTLWIVNSKYSQVEIKNAAGTVHLAAGTFDQQGVWKLFYRYSRWRAYFVANNVKL